MLVTMMKLTIEGRLLGLNPGIPGAPEDPHPPANTQQNIKCDVSNLNGRRHSSISIAIFQLH